MSGNERKRIYCTVHVWLPFPPLFVVAPFSQYTEFCYFRLCVCTRHPVWKDPLLSTCIQGNAVKQRAARNKENIKNLSFAHPHLAESSWYSSQSKGLHLCVRLNIYMLKIICMERSSSVHLLYSILFSSFFCPFVDGNDTTTKSTIHFKESLSIIKRIVSLRKSYHDGCQYALSLLFFCRSFIKTSWFKHESHKSCELCASTTDISMYSCTLGIRLWSLYMSGQHFVFHNHTFAALIATVCIYRSDSDQHLE